MLELQTSYLNAGTDILYAPTFTCNRLKLREYGLETDLYQMNMDLVALSKQAVAGCGHGYVAGDLTMTGEMLYPMGNFSLKSWLISIKNRSKFLLRRAVIFLL